INDDEDEAWEISGEEEEIEANNRLSPVGFFLTATVDQFQAMRNTMTNLLHPLRGVAISDLGEKCHLFKCFYEVDLDQCKSMNGLHFRNFIGQFQEYDTKLLMHGGKGDMHVK
ncbi:hypothetical protein Goarm_002150, partial [Gossypium armourianum]|nr:hypothetical protein [Gossypium armourianum]